MTGALPLGDIAFDLYERYVLLEHIGKLFRPAGPTYTVLDVGGHTTALWKGFPSLAGALIPDAMVAVVDALPAAELQHYVRASGVRLPFRDGAFDFVCSLDLLARVSVEDRPALLAELLRVTRNGLYVTFPLDSASNRWAEAAVAAYTSVVLKDPIPDLLDRARLGLPDREAVTQLFSCTGYPWIGFGQGNTDARLLMMLTSHSLRAPGTDFVQELNRRFNQVYAGKNWPEPHYRAGYLLETPEPRGLESIHSSLTPPGNADELQSVLAHCQLMLSVAHNGRLSARQGQHIRSIERELAVDVEYRGKR